MQAIVIDEITRRPDSTLVGCADYCFNQLRGGSIGYVGGAYVGSLTSNEYLGMQVGAAVNGDAALQELGQVGWAGLTGGDGVVTRVHHQATTTGKRQQSAGPGAQVAHGNMAS
jgi:hypothetical protein